MKKRMKIWNGIAVLSAVSSIAWAASSGESLQQALYAEEIEGDLPAAIAEYEKVINDASASDRQVAQALYRKGMCHVRLKQDNAAAAALSRLVNQYADRAELVERAQVVLEKLKYFDPASLMPADTKIYVELGSPGDQIDALFKMLEVSETENPLAPLMQSAGPGALQFFNPSMLAEIKKVRGLAFGCPQFDPNYDSSMVCVLLPGESDALRGMLIAMLSTAARPQEPVEGMQVLQIPDGPGIAYDDKVILAAYPHDRLVECIRQYKGISTNPSLMADNPTFRKIDKEARRHNAATLWIDADVLYDHLLQTDALPPQAVMIAGMAGVGGIDDLLLTHTIASDGLALDAILSLKEGVSINGYELIKTPPLQRDGLRGVPPEAFCLASVALSTNNPMQLQQLRQMLRIGNGEPLPAGYLENIEQVTLFALPGEAKIPEGMPFRPGIVLTCRDVAPVEQLLRERVGQSPDLPPLIIVEADKHTVLLSLEESVEMASFAAMKPENSVLKQGVLRDTVQQQIDSARKMVLLNASGLVRLIGIQSAFHSGADPETAEKLKTAFAVLAAELESTTLSVCSEEELQTLSLRARLKGIPSPAKLMGPIGEIQQVIADAEQQQAEAQAREQAARLEELLNLPPARMVETATAPSIDGELDEAWNAAQKYGLTKTIYVNPGPDYDLAASYRMMWDAEKLYVFVDVVDSTPANNPDQIWQFNDGIELYLDAADSKPAGYGDTQFQFGLLWNADDAVAICAQEHGRTVHAIETGLKNTEKGYCFEVAFLWSELGTTPADGAHIGVEVQVNDNRGRGGRDAKISWHDPYDQAWLNPQYFGRAVLSGEGE